MDNPDQPSPTKKAKKGGRSLESEEALRKRFADLAMASGAGPMDTQSLPPNPTLEKLDAGRIALSTHSACPIHTKFLLVHGIPATITMVDYTKLNSLIGLRTQAWTPKVQELWDSGRWKVLESLETILGKPTLLCSAVIELEDIRTFAVAVEEEDTPRIFKIPWEGSPKSLMVQAVPAHYREYIETVPEVLATRGFPADDAGEATLAVYGLLLRYLENTSSADTLTLLLPKYFAGPTSGEIKPGMIFPEIFGVTYLRQHTDREAFTQALCLNNLAGRRSTRSAGGWLLQIALTVDTLRLAHPEPILIHYYSYKIQGLRQGQDLRTLLEVILNNPGNLISMVLTAFIQRGARKSQMGTQDILEDHLILVYPKESEPPFINGDEAIRLLCHGDRGSYFSAQADGALVPGWKKLIDFYGWLQKQAKLNKGLNLEGNREGYLIVTKGKVTDPDGPAANSSTGTGKEMVPAKKDRSTEWNWPDQLAMLRQEFLPRAAVEHVVRAHSQRIDQVAQI